MRFWLSFLALAALLVVASLAAGCAPHVATQAEIDRAYTGQFGIMRAPPLGCSETSGPPWHAASWVTIWDGDHGFGYCSVEAGRPDRVRCVFEYCEPVGYGWRCGGR